MYNFMLSLEAAMSNLHTLASTVVEDIDLKTRWVAEADIGLMSKIFSVRKSITGRSLNNVRVQERELCKQCAELIATKIVELQKLIDSKIPHDTIVSIMRDWSDLSIAVFEHLEDSQFCGTNASEKKEKNKGHHKSVVQTDKQERPMNDETVAVPKTPWASAQEYIRTVSYTHLTLPTSDLV